MLFVFVYVWWCPTHVMLCFCFVFLHLVYPMLSVSLGCVVFLLCFSSSCVPYVASYSELSFFFIAPSVFSDVYLQNFLQFCYNGN